MKLFFYRTLATDEDGDPIDFGVIRAHSLGDAMALYDEYWREDMNLSGCTVRFYPFTSPDDFRGVLASGPSTSVTYP